MNDYILALDQGTSSSRAVLFDRAGQVAGIAQQPFRQIFPQPGWVEHCPLEIWKSQLTVMRRVLAEQGISALRVAAIGIANQRETVVLWDRATGHPLMNAIVWQDRRSAPFCEDLRRAGLAGMVREKTGLELDAYFSGTKLKWMLDRIPGARGRAERGELAAGTVDSWLVYKLSGAHVTDVSNASRTMLFNLADGAWDPALLEMLDIPASLLPRVVASSGIAAMTAPEILGCAVPIAGIAGDQQAATFGQGCHRSGTAKNTFGTGSFLLMNVGEEPQVSRHRLLSTAGWSLKGQTSYLIEGSVFMAGATLQWLCEGLGLVSHVDQIEALAATAPDAGGVMMVPAFAGLGAPHWDPFARGAILGLTRGSGKAQIARAALEGIACQNVEVLAAIEADAGVRLSELRVDGGGARSDLLMQLQADMLGVPVLRPVNTETTALGAAQLAGLGIGFWNSLDELSEHWRLQRRFVPGMREDQRLEHLHQWRRAVERAARWST